MYSDGTNSDIPVSNPATFNFASEDGFLCKPNTVDGTATGAQIIDPVTGLTYRSEIEAAITAQGFFPLGRSGRERAVQGGHADDSCRRHLELHLVLVLPVRHASGLRRARGGLLQRRDHRRQHRSPVIEQTQSGQAGPPLAARVQTTARAASNRGAALAESCRKRLICTKSI